ncbi:MMPL family transporter [Paenibacillus camelliae]|uniref:MMPL family transporter n=1 Tax=Paenibacillus camelliae TaxID=512410 RepID=UPI00203DD0EA|nr:MMPL family transporter [Paenibacillus camelliae]MCM3635530.1 MMPL family transporter [Paenibacillus camelliae]
MKGILKLRWIVIAVWIVAAVGLFIAAPNLASLVREKGEITVPEQYSSSLAAKLIEEKSSDSGSGNSTALVFHQEGGLTAEQQEEIQSALALLEENKEQLGIASITSYFDNEELKEQMLAPDESTAIVLLDVQMNGREVDQAIDQLYEALASIEIEHYYTGSWLISQDVLLSSEEGLKRTELITVGFILIVLFLVFRSAVAPIVPLLTVGLSYIVSQSIVAFLADTVDFPLSTFTQIFMMAVLFGIGTDYCILLISRYKEELSKHEDKQEAILTTYRTAGKTVLVSGIAVLVGFSAIGFSTFILYRSAVAVAVGIAVMLIALYTVVPFFLYTLGNKLFWPAKGKLEHGKSKLWDKVGAFSLKRPMAALLIVAIIIVPLLLTKDDLVSYNSLDEIGEKYDSVKGFNLIANNFGPGEAMPTTVVIKSEQPFDSSEGMAVIEKASRALLEQDGVATVRSATRPLGEPLEDFLVTDQVGQLEEGLSQGQDGLLEIRDGLAEAEQALAENTPQLNAAIDGAEQLVSGSKQLQDGVNKLSDGLSEISSGMKQGALSAKQLEAGLKELEQNALKLASASDELLQGYNELYAGGEQLSKGYAAIAEQQATLATGLSGVDQGMKALQQQYPELADDPTYISLTASIEQLAAGATALHAAIAELNQGLAGMLSGFATANTALAEASAGQKAFSEGMKQVAGGMSALRQGLDQLAAGTAQGSAQAPQLAEGLGGIAAGGAELQEGFVSIQEQLVQLTEGLALSVDGLEQVTDGFGSAENYLKGLVESPDKQLAGWYMPEEAITDEAFAAVLDQYMSDDRKLITFDVIMEDNPYAISSIEIIDGLSIVVKDQLAGTVHEGADVQLGGVTSMNNDLMQMSSADYSKTVTLMLIGIFIILLLLFRSVVIPIYVVASLLITYSTSLAITELIFVDIAGLSGVSWAVPFFGFVMLIALGVDYSIFLMDRFKENAHMQPTVAIHEAMKSMGSVIMSAAIILGGTFAAMLPSGVMSLLQIATLVLCGLFLYALIMLPLFIPVAVKLFGKYNWWPFVSRK